MKTILTLLILPALVVAQSHGPQQNEHFNIEFSMDIDMESIEENKIDVFENLEDTVALFITVEIYIEELFLEAISPQQVNQVEMINVLPNYLSTFSLLGFYSDSNKDSEPQERLNYLLALNDPMFPKENTMLNWLNPVKYEQNISGGAQNIQEGFGPRIQL